MNPNEVAQTIDIISTKFGPAAEQTFQIFLQRVIIENIIMGVVLAITVIVLPIAIYKVFCLARGSAMEQEAAYKAEKAKHEDKDSWRIPYIREPDMFSEIIVIGVAVIGGGFVWLLALSSLGKVIINLLSPEYTTIMRLIEAAGGII